MLSMEPLQKVHLMKPKNPSSRKLWITLPKIPRQSRNWQTWRHLPQHHRGLSKNCLWFSMRRWDEQCWQWTSDFPSVLENTEGSNTLVYFLPLFHSPLRAFAFAIPSTRKLFLALCMIDFFSFSRPSHCKHYPFRKVSPPTSSKAATITTAQFTTYLLFWNIRVSSAPPVVYTCWFRVEKETRP